VVEEKSPLEMDLPPTSLHQRLHRKSLASWPRAGAPCAFPFLAPSLHGGGFPVGSMGDMFGALSIF
jgi:hypothetical protein